MSFVLAIDQGTSATKALVVDAGGTIHGLAEVPIKVVFDSSGGVEVDPNDLLQSVISAGLQALHASGNPPLSAIGLANQGETVVAWSRTSGAALGNAIVWQDHRSAGVCRDLGEQSVEIEQITGMKVDPYFVAPKISWLQRRLVDQPADTVVTTSDVWLLNRMCGSYSTDVSTASRTLLTDLDTLAWSSRCAQIFGIDESWLPAIHDNDSFLGATTLFGGNVPVVGTCVDQQAALYAENCRQIGETKCTFGTGAFMLAACGDLPRRSATGLTPCAAWRMSGESSWCLDGQVFTAGSAISWLIEVGILRSASEIDELCNSNMKGAAPTFVPALAGLGAPWWRPNASGRLTGLTMATSRADLVRATLVGIAAQVALLCRAAESDLGQRISVLKVDGGLTRSASLVQLQADLAQCAIQLFPSPHATALGIAEMSLRSIGELKTVDNLASQLEIATIVEPKMSADEANAIVASWSIAAEQSAYEANG